MQDKLKVPTYRTLSWTINFCPFGTSPSKFKELTKALHILIRLWKLFLDFPSTGQMPIFLDKKASAKRWMYNLPSTSFEPSQWRGIVTDYRLRNSKQQEQHQQMPPAAAEPVTVVVWIPSSLPIAPHSCVCGKIFHSVILRGMHRHIIFQVLELVQVDGAVPVFVCVLLVRIGNRATKHETNHQVQKLCLAAWE